MTFTTISLVFLAIAACIILPIVKRILADAALFWIRIRENTICLVTRDEDVERVLVATKDPERFRLIKNLMERCATDDPDDCISVEKASGVMWIGPPWIYSIFTWYETEEDEKDPSVPGLHTLDLSEQVWVCESIDENSVTGVPHFKTADGIEAKTSLTLNTIVADPYKSLFKVRYRRRAILKRIFSEWRQVISGMKFFEGSDFTLESIRQRRQSMQQELSRLGDELKVRLGLCERSGDSIVELAPEQYFRGSSAKYIYDNWGTQITNVTVDDFEASNPEVEKLLEGVLKAEIEAIRQMQASLADAQSAEAEAEVLKKLAAAVGGDNAGQLIAILKTMKESGGGGGGQGMSPMDILAMVLLPKLLNEKK
jgi:hypothetical protein